MYGGEARIAALRKLFPQMEDKKSLASKEELSKVNGKASLLAAVDYYVSMQSDVFISASPGNMHNALASLPHIFFSSIILIDFIVWISAMPSSTLSYSLKMMVHTISLSLYWFKASCPGPSLSFFLSFFNGSLFLSL